MRSAIAKMCGGSDPMGRLRYRLIWGGGGGLAVHHLTSGWHCSGLAYGIARWRLVEARGQGPSSGQRRDNPRSAGFHACVSL